MSLFIIHLCILFIYLLRRNHLRAVTRIYFHRVISSYIFRDFYIRVFKYFRMDDDRDNETGESSKQQEAREGSQPKDIPSGSSRNFPDLGASAMFPSGVPGMYNCSSLIKLKVTFLKGDALYCKVIFIAKFGVKSPI